ncbi:hypothetical protein ACFVFS_36070 [Kitasatospora sp. NPDC057692]|uniref:hypothetical protein n=1 Tax=Kitasatospora sp. NPDC057692 TaxID=3346215 RepID=UPI0036CA31BE
MEVKYWLRKSPRLIRATLKTVDEAVDWMAGELAQHPYPESYGSSDDARLRFVRDTLSLTAGNDVVWGWYPNASQYISRALIACPRTADGIPCPQGL